LAGLHRQMTAAVWPREAPILSGEPSWRLAWSDSLRWVESNAASALRCADSGCADSGCADSGCADSGCAVLVSTGPRAAATARRGSWSSASAPHLLRRRTARGWSQPSAAVPRADARHEDDARGCRSTWSDAGACGNGAERAAVDSFLLHRDGRSPQVEGSEIHPDEEATASPLT
jgi:hypothetical protein